MESSRFIQISEQILIEYTYASQATPVTFNNTQGIMIDQNSPEFKNIQMKNRKPFGFGINMGMGITGEGNFGPYIGLGVSWNPKLLQW